MQVSRLGNPLINEVIIPLGQKDFWNRSSPRTTRSSTARYTDARGRAPRERALRQRLGHRAAPWQIDETGRTDLDAILLTGVPGLNFTGPTQADLLRLNTALKPGVNGACPGGTASAAAPDRLAVLNADLCGFPNGRRLADDVVDIELRAVAQGYGTFLNASFGLPNKSPNNLARRRRGRERRAVLEHVPVRRGAAPGLRGAVRPEPARRREGTRPDPLPPRPPSKEQSVRRMRLIVGAAAAAATVAALLLGGIFRESSAAAAGAAGDAAGAVTATGSSSPVLGPAASGTAADGGEAPGHAAGGSRTM